MNYDDYMGGLADLETRFQPDAPEDSKGGGISFASADTDREIRVYVM